MASEALQGSPVEQLRDFGVRISANRDVWEARLDAVVPRESFEEALDLLGDVLPRWIVDPAREELVAELDPRLRGRVDELLRDTIEVTDQGSPATPRPASGAAGAVRVAVAGDVDVEPLTRWMSSLNRKLDTGGGCRSGATSLGLPAQRVVWSVRDDAPAAGMMVWLIHEVDSTRSRWRRLERWLAKGPGSPADLFRSNREERIFEPWYRAVGTDGIFGIYFETASGEAHLFRSFVLSALIAAADTPGETGLIRARHARWMEESLTSEDPELLAALLLRDGLSGSVDSEESGARSIADEARELKAAAAELLSREALIVGRGNAEDARRLALPDPRPAPLLEPAIAGQPLAENSRSKLKSHRPVQRDPEREPVIAVSVRFRMGSAYERPEQSGFSDLLLKSIRLGAGGHTPEVLERALWDAGCTLDERLDEQSGGLILVCPRGGLETGLSLMLTMVAEPDFPEPEFSELVVRWGVGRRLGGEHLPLEPAAPLRRLLLDLVEPRASLLPAPSAQELKRFHHQFMVRKNLAVGLAGTFTVRDEDAISDGITAELSRLHEGAPAQLRQASEVQPVSFEPIRMDIETARIAWGHRAPPKGHPDEPAVALLVDVLAGPGATRLRESLEDLGDLRGQYLRHPARGGVLLEASALGGKAALLQKRMALELDRYRREGPSPAELNRSIARLRGQTSDRIANVADRADFRARAALESWSESTWLESLQALTVEQVRNAAITYLPEKLQSSAILPRQD